MSDMREENANILPDGIRHRKDRRKWISILLLQAAVFIQSLAGVFSKFASGNNFWSWNYWFPFGLSLVCTGLYALLWQLSLKRLSLLSAFLGKAVGTVWMAIFGCLLFQEVLNAGKVVGLILVVVGSFFVVSEHE